MWTILFKELIYSVGLMGLAAIIIFTETGHLPRNWFILIAAIFSFFPGSTLLLNVLKKEFPGSQGWALMGLSVLKMFLIPLLIILLFEREHEATPAVVIPTLIAYLILIGLDTHWKVKWIFK
jgi:hypothetical protein